MNTRSGDTRADIYLLKDGSGPFPVLLGASPYQKALHHPREETGHDLIGAIFFLASPDADFISGQTVDVDGGKHMP